MAKYLVEQGTAPALSYDKNGKSVFQFIARHLETDSEVLVKKLVKAGAVVVSGMEEAPTLYLEQTSEVEK